MTFKSAEQGNRAVVRDRELKGNGQLTFQDQEKELRLFPSFPSNQLSETSRNNGLSGTSVKDILPGLSTQRIKTKTLQIAGEQKNEVFDYTKKPFPQVVHAMVTNTSETHPSIIRWICDGEAFVIEQKSERLRDILQVYFRHTKYASLQRQLNAYGWKKSVKGMYKGAFHHPNFHRNKTRVSDFASIKRIAPSERKQGGKNDPCKENDNIVACRERTQGIKRHLTESNSVPGKYKKARKVTRNDVENGATFDVAVQTMKSRPDAPDYVHLDSSKSLQAKENLQSDQVEYSSLSDMSVGCSQIAAEVTADESSLSPASATLACFHPIPPLDGNSTSTSPVCGFPVSSLNPGDSSCLSGTSLLHPPSNGMPLLLELNDSFSVGSNPGFPEVDLVSPSCVAQACATAITTPHGITGDVGMSSSSSLRFPDIGNSNAPTTPSLAGLVPHCQAGPLAKSMASDNLSPILTSPVQNWRSPVHFSPGIFSNENIPHSWQRNSENNENGKSYFFPVLEF